MSDADMADDIEQLRLHLGLKQIDLLGHSNGGTIVLAYAERYSLAVRRLILLTHWLSGYDDSAVWKAFLDKRRDVPYYAEAVKTIESPDPPPDEQVVWVRHITKFLSFYVVKPESYPPFVEAMGQPSRWVDKA
jgi:proline iminopeptidase